ncbi:ATP-binding cassette domain-containing protein [Streptomyces sp. bgisy060]|uniref:ATP-binding cassette domain-containing protein n=1 Tax=Streptomyces sp. bgisy060 TaxID=3413775 RepID=UPI003EBD78C3
MRLERVGRRHGPRGRWVLREVSLELPTAALVRVVGANGSGKSTLLRLFAGIDAPGEGRVTGRPARTAYVPERFPAALPFTAVDYLVHLGRVQGLDQAAARTRAGEWLERFAVGTHAGTALAELSKGTSQKVAVAQALLADPALLVLDEAWTGLDPDARTVLDAAVRERLAAGTTVVFVDHDPRRLEGEADVVYGVVRGRVRSVPGVRGEAGAAPGPAGRNRPPEGRPSDPHGPDPALPAPAVPAPGPPVSIRASGGRTLPVRLPGDPTTAPGPDGTTVLTVDAEHSDALLGVLLAASWHIHHLDTGGVRA